MLATARRIPPARIQQPIRGTARFGCNQDTDEAPRMLASMKAVAELMTDLTIVEFAKDQMHDGLERNPELDESANAREPLSLNQRKKPHYRVLLIWAG